MKKVLLIMAVCLAGCSPPTEEVNFSVGLQEVCYVLGQSNATQYVADGYQSVVGGVATSHYHPGQSIKMWYDDERESLFYNDLTFMVNNGLPDTIIWFQGEQDRHTEEDRAAYFIRTLNFLACLRHDLGYQPRFIFCIVDYTGPEPIEIWEMSYIRACQFYLCANYNIEFIDTRGYERPDGLHLSTEEYIRLGENIGGM